MKVVEIQNQFGIDSLAVADRPEPKPGFGQLVVRMRAFSLNYRDLLVVRGQYNPKLKLPFVPLSDGAGEVAAVGPGVTRVQVGERVAGTFMQGWEAGRLTDAKARTALGGALEGIMAEYALLDEAGVVPIPEHLSFEEAATLPCAALTAWHALAEEDHLRPGAVVLAQGTGGVSIFALQFARLLGARVIITSSSDAKLARARELGANDLINYKSDPDWDEKVRQITGGVGVDHVVEVGGAGTLSKSLRAVRPGGFISLIGVLTGGAGQVNLTAALMKNVRIQGVFVGSREMFENMNRAISLHRLRPAIDKVFDFADAKAAFRHMESGSHFGKICIRV